MDPRRFMPISAGMCVSVGGGQFPGISRLEGTPCGVEFRLDTLDTWSASLIEEIPPERRWVATFRTSEHGGLGSPEERNGRGWRARLECLEAGFSWVDLEWNEPDLPSKIDAIRRRGGRVVLSHHDWNEGLKLPRNVTLRETDVVKWIAHGSSFDDFVRQRRLYTSWKACRLICFFMGDEYRDTRLLALLYGAPFVFVALDEDSLHAPGQLTLNEVKTVYRRVKLGPTPCRLFGVVGFPVGHSRSPAFHQPRLSEANEQALFLRLPCRDDRAFKACMDLFPELCGLAVTRPLKEVAQGWVCGDGVHGRPEVDSANTLVRHAEGWQSWNTDRLALRQLLNPYPRHYGVRVLGYGGLGRAAVQASLDCGFPTQVTNRDPRRIRQAPDHVNRLPWSQRHDKGARILVQATSAGMIPNVDLSPLDRMPTSVEVFIESIYAPAETRCVMMARHAGCEVILGDALFLAQAEHQSLRFLATLKGAVR